MRGPRPKSFWEQARPSRSRIYSKLFDTYNQEKGVKVNYQAIGSGGGIQQLKAKTVDFGGTDDCMKDKEMAEAGAPILHIPTCLGAVVITYNVPGDPAIKLTSNLIVDIFLGRIEKWNDKRIVDMSIRACCCPT